MNEAIELLVYKRLFNQTFRRVAGSCSVTKARQKPIQVSNSSDFVQICDCRNHREKRQRFR